MDYRRATVEDIDVLVSMRMAMRAEREERACPLDIAEFESGTREFFLRSMPGGDFIVWLAVEGDSVAGNAGLCLHRVPPTYGNPSGKIAYLVNMYVVPGYRGLGVATRLLELLVEEAERLGCGRAVLNASKAGRPVYEKFGFTDVPGEMEYFLD